MLKSPLEGNFEMWQGISQQHWWGRAHERQEHIESWWRQDCVEMLAGTVRGSNALWPGRTHMGMCCMENSQIAECRIKDWSSEMPTYSKVRTRAARKGLNKALWIKHMNQKAFPFLILLFPILFPIYVMSSLKFIPRNNRKMFLVRLLENEMLSLLKEAVDETWTHLCCILSI